jgi:cytochrome c oxidase subunit 2
LLLLTACHGPLSVLSPGGPAARTLSRLGWFVMLVFSAATVIVWAILVWAAGRRHGSLLEHEPIDEHDGHSWIVIGGFAIPAAVLGVVFVLTLTTMRAFPLDHHPGEADIRVTGRQWWWQVEYVRGGPDQRLRTASEIHIPTGRLVTIELETRDVIHSFWVPRLHGKVDLIPGMVNRIHLQASAPGVYQGQCAEFCGLQHTKMRFLVVADTPERFEAWLREQRAAAVPAVTPEATQGRELFLTGACSACHTIRGTPARGTIGPDLTHLASRGMIAGALPNDTADLAAWVTHAQSLKPGARMPSLAQFEGDELRALVSYLQTLR